MYDGGFVRRRVLVTMTRGDEAARGPGDPLQFVSLGGVVAEGRARAAGRKGVLPTRGDPWAVYRLGRPSRPGGQAP